MARLLGLCLLLLCLAPTASDGAAEYTLHCAYHGFSRHARVQHGPGHVSGLFLVYAGVRARFPSGLTLRDLSDGESPVSVLEAAPGALAGVVGLRCDAGGAGASFRVGSVSDTSPSTLPWHLIPLPRRRAQDRDGAWASSSPSRPDRLLDAIENSLDQLQPRTADAVDAMIMLRYHDSTGIIADSPVWKRQNRADNRQAQPQLPLSSCKLTFPRCSEQRFWPAKFLTVQEGSAPTTNATWTKTLNLAGTEYGPLVYHREHPHRTDSIRPRSPVTLHLFPHTSRAAARETANGGLSYSICEKIYTPYSRP